MTTFNKEALKGLTTEQLLAIADAAKAAAKDAKKDAKAEKLKGKRTYPFSGAEVIFEPSSAGTAMLRGVGMRGVVPLFANQQLDVLSAGDVTILGIAANIDGGLLKFRDETEKARVRKVVNDPKVREAALLLSAAIREAAKLS